MNISPRSTVVRVTGEVTGEEFSGAFEVKPILTHGEQMDVDRIRRDILGPRPSDATPRAFSQANLFAECQQRITKAPSWWKDAGNGMNLFDDNVVRGVYAAVMQVEEDFRKSLTEAAEAAKKEIAKTEVK